MALLTDTDIRKILCSNHDWSDKIKLHIHPFNEDCLTPVGYDLRVGSQYSSAMAATLEPLQLGGNGKSAPCRHPIPVQVGTLIRNMPAGDSGASRQVFCDLAE